MDSSACAATVVVCWSTAAGVLPWFDNADDGVSLHSLPDLQLQSTATRTARASCFAWDEGRQLLVTAAKKKVLHCMTHQLPTLASLKPGTPLASVTIIVVQLQRGVSLLLCQVSVWL